MRSLLATVAMSAVLSPFDKRADQDQGITDAQRKKMKPHIIMHMASTIDGRIVTKHWPKEVDVGAMYESIHRDLQADAWIVGPTTMAEFSEGAPIAASATEIFPRVNWRAEGAKAGPYAIAIDRKGSLHLNVAKVNGDPLIHVLARKVSDAHLAELRRDGISYVFAGDSDVDLALAVAMLRQEYAIDVLLLEGGGGINGAFLDAGLIDEISLMLLPIADGGAGMPSLFDRTPKAAAQLQLTSVSQLDHGVLHLRYLTAK